MSPLADALVAKAAWRGTASGLAATAQALLIKDGDSSVEPIGRNGVIAYRGHRILSAPDGKTFVWRHLVEFCAARVLVSHGWTRKQLSEWMPHQSSEALLDAIRVPTDPVGADELVAHRRIREQAEIAFRLLALGIVDLFRQVRDGQVVVHGPTLPASLKTALFRLSELCISIGEEDRFGSTHDLVRLCTTPVGSSVWPLPVFREPDFAYAGVRLIDPDSRLPTLDAIELSRTTLSELDLREQMAFGDLRATAERFVGAGPVSYSALRRFIAEHPITTLEQIKDFERENGLQLADPFIQSCYEPVQPHHLVGETLCRCEKCESPMRPGHVSGTAACALPQCLAFEKMVEPAKAAVRRTPTTRIARPHILMYWIAPAIDELAIARKAAKLGIEHAVYPMFDACDVSLEAGNLVGIDVKSYASPFVLAHALNRGIGGLSLYSKKIIAINDRSLARFPRYLDILQREYRGAVALSFTGVGDLLKRIGAGA